MNNFVAKIKWFLGDPIRIPYGFPTDSLQLLQILRNFQIWWNSDEISLKFSKIWMKFSKNLQNLCKILASFLVKFWVQSGAKGWKYCRSRKIWKNAPTLAIVAVDTAENEPSKVCPLSVYRSSRCPDLLLLWTSVLFQFFSTRKRWKSQKCCPIS